MEIVPLLATAAANTGFTIHCSDRVEFTPFVHSALVSGSRQLLHLQLLYSGAVTLAP